MEQRRILNEEESKLAFEKVKTIESFLKLWSRFYDNEVFIPTYNGQFVDPDGDNPQADQILADKFKDMTKKGLIPLDSQVMIPFKQKAYLNTLCPREWVKSFCGELNRYEDIVAFWMSNAPDDDVLEDFSVTYDSSTDAKNPTKIPGAPYSRVHSLNEIDTIQNWLSDKMKGEINSDIYVSVNIVSPSFKTNPFYIFDIVNKALDTLKIFTGFGDLVAKGDYAKVVDYYYANLESIDLDTPIRGLNLGVILLKSMTPIEYKNRVLKFLFEKGMFALEAYNFLDESKHKKIKGLKPEQIVYLRREIYPFLPEWYKKSQQ